MCVCTYIYIRSIASAWHFYIPEHFRCSLMRVVRDIDLHHIHWVVWGTGTPKDRDEVNRREF